VVLEAIVLNIRPGQGAAYEAAFKQAEPIITSMRGYRGHQLQRCLEVADQYLLLVRWEKLTDHTEGFRNHPDFVEWKRLLHHFYDPPPVIQHYELIAGS